MNAFEPSSCAPAARGPKHFSPRCSKRSTRPPTSGVSGPTIVRPTRLRERELEQAVEVLGRDRDVADLRLARRARVAGRDEHLAHERRLREAFQAIACSRPPPPITSTFTLAAPTHSMAEVPHAGEHHRDAVLVGRAHDFFVANRAAGLHDRAYAVLGRRVDAVAEREERVRCERGACSGSPASAALSAPIRALITRLGWPAPMPSVAPPRA